MYIYIYLFIRIRIIKNKYVYSYLCLNGSSAWALLRTHGEARVNPQACTGAA